MFILDNFCTCLFCRFSSLTLPPPNTPPPQILWCIYIQSRSASSFRFGPHIIFWAPWQCLSSTKSDPFLPSRLFIIMLQLQIWSCNTRCFQCQMLGTKNRAEPLHSFPLPRNFSEASRWPLLETEYWTRWAFDPIQQCCSFYLTIRKNCTSSKGDGLDPKQYSMSKSIESSRPSFC